MKNCSGRREFNVYLMLVTNIVCLFLLKHGAGRIDCNAAVVGRHSKQASRCF